MPDFTTRAVEEEIMDDLSRPDAEFMCAYRELEIINRRLGGIRAVERFIPATANLLMLDVAAGACDVAESIARRIVCRIVVLDRNDRGLKLARKSMPLTADASDLPFADNTFDVVMASLFFHHLSDRDCAHVLKQMWRISRRLVLVNDLHRHPVAYYSIALLTMMFSRSAMVRNDAPLSVRRAFRPEELLRIAGAAGIPATVKRSFPYRLVLIAEKKGQ